MVKKEKDLIKIALDQAALASEFEKDNRDKALEDLEFVFSEDQWDASVKTQRGTRPCLNANDLPIFLDQVVGDQRMNRTGIKVHPVDSNTDPAKAEVIGGLIRGIEQASDAHVAYDRALEFVVAGGYCGAIRVITQYESDDLFDDDGKIKAVFTKEGSINAFDQEVRIVPVDNPLNVLFDPSAKLWDRNDGEFVFYYDDIPIETFEKRHPGKRVMDFDGDDLPTSLKSWGNQAEKTVRIAEWFLKEPNGSKTIYLILNDFEQYEIVTTPPEDKRKIINHRTVDDFKIMWRLISGYEVLEGPIEIPGRLFPIIPVWGKEININGVRKLRGMFRYVKDPQRMYIYTQSAITEMLALAPKNPYIGTPKMFEGFEDKWREMNTQNYPYLPFNPDERMVGGYPKREDPPQVPMGLVEQAAARQAEKKDIIGLHNASLGKRSNETSGLAIKERKRSGDVVSYAFLDNLSRAIKQTGRVVVGMVPKIYTTSRVLRIMGIDGKQSTQAVNQQMAGPQGEPLPAIDLTIGKHDIVVMTGPGYATQRLEALDRLTQIMQYAPSVAALIAPVAVDMMDIPHAEKLVKMLEATLPPQVKAALDGKDTNLTQEQVVAMIQQAVEQYKGSLEGQQEALKTEQQRLKVEQERYQLEQERMKVAQGADKIREIVTQMVANGEL